MPEPIRITKVLNYFKEPWYIDWMCRVGKREANKVSKKAMKIGSLVDSHIKMSLQKDMIVNALIYKDTKEVATCLDAYHKWLDVYKPKSITPCTRLFATIEGHEVTGEPDIMVDDVLVDIKCSSKISPSYWVQVNMYQYLSLFEPATDLRKHESQAGKVGILRLDKVTSSYEYVVKDYDTSLVDCWLGLMRAYCYFNKEKHDGDEL